MLMLFGKGRTEKHATHSAGRARLIRILVIVVFLLCCASFQVIAYFYYQQYSLGRSTRPSAHPNSSSILPAADRSPNAPAQQEAQLPLSPVNPAELTAEETNVDFKSDPKRSSGVQQYHPGRSQHMIIPTSLTVTRSSAHNISRPSPNSRLVDAKRLGRQISGFEPLNELQPQPENSAYFGNLSQFTEIRNDYFDTETKFQGAHLVLELNATGRSRVVIVSGGRRLPPYASGLPHAVISVSHPADLVLNGRDGFVYNDRGSTKFSHYHFVNKTPNAFTSPSQPSPRPNRVPCGRDAEAETVAARVRQRVDDRFRRYFRAHPQFDQLYRQRMGRARLRIPGRLLQPVLVQNEGQARRISRQSAMQKRAQNSPSQSPKTTEAPTTTSSQRSSRACSPSGRSPWR